MYRSTDLNDFYWSICFRSALFIVTYMGFRTGQCFLFCSNSWLLGEAEATVNKHFFNLFLGHTFYENILEWVGEISVLVCLSFPFSYFILQRSVHHGYDRDSFFPQQPLWLQEDKDHAKTGSGMARGFPLQENPYCVRVFLWKW